VATALTAAILICAGISCQGHGRWSEEWEQAFESFQPSGRILDIMELEPGMAVGEIGAGNGRFAVKVAARVGSTGVVYANDIDPRALEFMRDRRGRDRIGNLVVIRGEETEPGFPAGRLDVVYLINTYEHLARPVELFRNARPALKPEGRLILIVTDPVKMPQHRGHAVARDVVEDQVRRAGFELAHVDTSLIYDNIYLFHLPSGNRTGEDSSN
jgi:SAM-dependent methyltransferase